METFNNNFETSRFQVCFKKSQKLRGTTSESGEQRKWRTEIRNNKLRKWKHLIITFFSWYRTLSKAEITKTITKYFKRNDLKNETCINQYGEWKLGTNLKICRVPIQGQSSIWYRSKSFTISFQKSAVRICWAVVTSIDSTNRSIWDGGGGIHFMRDGKKTWILIHWTNEWWVNDSKCEENHVWCEIISSLDSFQYN